MATRNTRSHKKIASLLFVPLFVFFVAILDQSAARDKTKERWPQETQEATKKLRGIYFLLPLCEIFVAILDHRRLRDKTRERWPQETREASKRLRVYFLCPFVFFVAILDQWRRAIKRGKDGHKKHEKPQKDCEFTFCPLLCFSWQLLISDSSRLIAE